MCLHTHKVSTPHFRAAASYLSCPASVDAQRSSSASCKSFAGIAKTRCCMWRWIRGSDRSFLKLQVKLNWGFLSDTHTAANCPVLLFVAEADVLSCASGEDCWSLDIFIPHPFHWLVAKRGLRDSGWNQGGKVTLTSDQFFSVSLLSAKKEGR